MHHPVNNLALSLSQIPLKNFVKESDSTVETEKSNKFKLKFEGDKAKLAYDEIISDASAKKSFPRQSESNSKNQIKTPIKIAVKKVNDVNTLFKAIELGDTNFIRQHFNSENVNISDQFGWTPLMCAAYSGYKEIVAILMKLGANVKTKDKSGYTAVDLALKKNHLDIINILKQSSCKKTEHKKTVVNDQLLNNNKWEEKAIEEGGFYCDICKIFFIESSRKNHETSTLHIFNSEPKLANTFYGIPKQNKGYQMLLNKGWSEKGGLGPAGEGKKYPIKTILKRDRKGLGQSDKNIARITHFNPNDRNAVKFYNRHKQKASKKKDRLKQLNRESQKTKALRKALS